MINTDLKNVGIIVDFDGTITKVDSNDLICATFGNAKNEIIEQEIRKGNLTLKEGTVLNYEQVSLTEEEYNQFVLANIEIQQGFKEFYTKVNMHNIPFAVVSGGFVNAIELIFEREGITGIDIYANRLIFEDNSNSIAFYNEHDKCYKGTGPCGNCKLENLREFHKYCQKVVFIGDGITDICAAQEADILFAKDELEDYCLKEQIPYIKYNDFFDIANEIFE